ncbi:MAG: flagellar biosynthetic protein FliR [Desulfurobacteriaceae bacterium]
MDFGFVFQYKSFVLTYILVLIRTASILSFVPVINHPALPIAVRVTLNLFLALMLTLLLTAKGIIFDTKVFESPLELFLGILNDVFFGFAVTLWIRLFFTATVFAGDIIGTVGGFAMAHIFDPTAGQSVIIGRFFLIAMLMLFVTGGFLDAMIQALYLSFLKYPPLHCQIESSFLWMLVKKFNQSFSLGIQIASPIVLIVLLFNISLALVARVMPQMNVFFVAIPVQISIVLLFLALISPYIMDIIYDTLREEISEIFIFLSSG